jgi:hypothetical protein
VLSTRASWPNKGLSRGSMLSSIVQGGGKRRAFISDRLYISVAVTWKKEGLHPPDCFSSRQASILSLVRASDVVAESLAGTYSSTWLGAGIGNCRLHSLDNLPQDLPVLHAQVARQALLDRDLDLGANQTSADSKEGGRLGLGRMNHSYRPCSCQTWARSRRKPALNAVRLPTGRPGPPGLPGWKGLRLASCC